MTKAQVYIKIESLRKQAELANKAGLKGAAADLTKEIQKVQALCQ